MSRLEAPFTLDLWEAADVEEPASGPATGRVVLAKTYTGPDLVGTATGHALTTRGPGGASYVAQERVTGTLYGREGSFVLEHSASMGEGQPTLQSAWIVPGSGTRDLVGLSSVASTGTVAHELLTIDLELPEP